MTFKTLRFWVVTILLSPIFATLYLAWGVAVIVSECSEHVATWIDKLGWVFLWAHHKLAGVPVKSFRVHMRNRGWL